jgi:hypothetical protein
LRRKTGLPEDNENIERRLREVREKTDKLEGELAEGEALDILEEAVEEVERLGEQLEKGGS